MTMAGTPTTPSSSASPSEKRTSTVNSFFSCIGRSVGGVGASKRPTKSAHRNNRVEMYVCLHTQ